jgi:hypothetical protein
VQLNPRLPAQTVSRFEESNEVVAMRSFLVICLLFLCNLGAFGQESDDPATGVGIAELFLAKDDGTGKAGDQATSFVTTDVPIYCVVQLDSSMPVTVKMNLVAVAVPGVKAETKVVSASYTTKDNQDRVNFTGRPAGQWVAGLYRVDVFVGNLPAVSREFAVQKSTQAKPSPKPASRRSADKSRLAGPIRKP